VAQRKRIPKSDPEAEDIIQAADGKATAPPGFQVIKLSQPIMVEDVMRFDLIVPNKLTLGDLQATDAAQGDIEKAIFLIAKIAKIPITSAMSIDAVDLRESADLGKYITHFLA